MGIYAFNNCSNLEYFDIPYSVSIESIPDFCFGESKKLKSIKIPNSVTMIKSYAFYYCENLESVTLPNNLNVIKESGFEQCYSLSSIEFPETLTSIGRYAFWNCISLREITLPNSITSLGWRPFSCSNTYAPVYDGDWGSLPNLVIFVNSNAVENLVKLGFFGTIINLSNN